MMSKAEILAELPALQPEERRQVYERLCQLEEEDLLRGIGPGDDEKRLLDEAQTHFEQDGDRGIPWRAVLGTLRTGRQP
jgi:hypothetical protein